AASVFITPFRTCRGIHNGRIGSRVANISKTSNHAVGLCCYSISKFRNQRLEQIGYTLCSPESMYPCNHGLRGKNTKNQYDIDDFDLIKKMGGFTNDGMASGSLDKAVAEFKYLNKGIDLVAGRV